MTEIKKVVQHLIYSILAVFCIIAVSASIAVPEENQALVNLNPPKTENVLDQITKNKSTIESISFKQVLPETAVLFISLPDNYGPIEVTQTEDQIHVSIQKAYLAEKWRYNMSVNDSDLVLNIQGKQDNDTAELILTTDKTVKVQKDIRGSQLEVTLSENDEKSSYSNDIFNHNEKISLNLQNISVRSALQVLADFAKFNLVTSDNVIGNISLQLKHVPWQEVLDIILVAKNLGKRKIGNTLYIAPASVIAVQEQEALAAQNATQAAEPLKTEFIHLNYADAKELYQVLTSKEQDILSPRGSINVDYRTNTIIVQDIQSQINKVDRLVAELDIPTQQVLIEARIVEISRDVINELGIDYSGSANFSIGSKFGGTASGGVNPNYVTPTIPPVAGSSTLGISFARLPGSISLNMELLALESEGEAKQVSNPHLVVSDNEEAYITQGQEIPYLESTSSGAASLTFKDAVLELRVTPQIAPNNYLVMTILVKKDQKTEDETAGGAPILNKREIKTRLLMKNEETIVLGGIYEKDISHQRSKIPLLGDLPFIGWLFSSHSERITNRELLIFLTPHIVQ